MDAKLFQYHLLKRHLFSTELPLFPHQRPVDYIFMVLYLDSLFCSIYLCVFYFVNIMWSWLLQLIVNFEIEWYGLSSFVIPLQYCLGYSSFFTFPCKFRISFLSSTEYLLNILQDFDGDCVDSIKPMRTDIITIFQPMDIKSIYLDLLWFLSLEFYSSPLLDPIQIII